MTETGRNASSNGRQQRPLTTRRGFIAAASLGGVSLYGLWAAFGAAPLSLAGGSDHDGHETPEAGGHGGHGAARGPGVDEFRRLADEFIARHRQADGSVRVDAASAHAAPTPTSGTAEHGAHAGHGAAATAPTAPSSGPAEVYLVAQRYSYEPALLRLSAGAPYRFRMMALDAAHGASIQLGAGSRIVRLRQGALVEQDLTFTRPGEYLVYCTMYCGIGHHLMSARIVVS
ncbi:MAG: hypothetical protein L6R19_24960 [Alphaproteobacteria bacterium]|nr:hypothetical protein [Alphaproteobacteria bacterium]